MTNVQLYFATGVPSFSILVGILIGIFQLNYVLNQSNLRFTSLESTLNSGFTNLDGRINLLEQEHADPRKGYE